MQSSSGDMDSGRGGLGRWGTPPITGEDPVVNVILNNMIDVDYDPAVAHRRRRLEWPSRNDPCFANLDNYDSDSVPDDTKRLAAGVIASEFSKCGGENLRREDIGCMDELVAIPRICRRPQDQGALLHALYYRGRQQSAYWDVFCALVDKNFIKSDGLCTPIDLDEITPTVRRVSWRLMCFELPNKEQEARYPENPYNLWCAPFAEPTLWLATMIVRGCSDIESLFETIRASGFLGALNDEAYQEYQQKCHPKSFNVNRKEREGASKKAGPFGFWLPHGIQDASTIYEGHVMRFNAIEEALKRYFDFDDEVLLLERDQESYYEKNPQNLPGYTPGF